MEYFKRKRIERGLSIAELAQRCNISPQRLSDYEAGRRRYPDEVKHKIAQQLGLPTLISAGPYLGMTEHRTIGKWSRWAVYLEPGPNWADHQVGYEDLMKTLSTEKLPSLEFRRFVRCDSSLEALAWSLLANSGAEPLWASPVMMNFERYPLISGMGRSLGTVSCAALQLRLENLHYIVWPQMTLLTPRRRRFDGLIRFNHGRRGRWILMEIDGGAHSNPEWDARRDEEIDLPVLRFKSFEVRTPDFPAKFMDRLRAQIH